MHSSTVRNLLLLAMCGACSLKLSAEPGNIAGANQADAYKQFSLNLPAGALQKDASFAVELDGYDVTPFANAEGGTLSLSLETPLAAGDHILVVLQFFADGSIETVVEQTIQVEASTASQWQLNATFDTGYRVEQKEKEDFAGVPHLAGTGAIDAGGSSSVGNWQLASNIQAMYDSTSENNIDNDEWALAHYNVAVTYQADKSSTGVELGHIQVDREDLLFASYQRRGIAAASSGRGGDYQVQVFGVNSEPTTRYDGDHLVPNASSEKSAGVTAMFALAGEYLQLRAGYIDGEGTLGGAGINFDGDPTIYGGDSWNAALDSYWLNRSIWLHGEYAESEFDSDGIGVGEDPESDKALQAVVKFSSEGDLGEGIFDYWSALLHYQEVGADYYSMGNIYLPGDIEMHRVFLQAAKGGLAIDAEWAQEESNVDDDPLLTTLAIERQNLTLNYTPMSIDPGAFLWRVMGMPSMNASYLRSDQSQPDSDAVIGGYDLDNLTEQASITLQFAKDFWNWSITHQVTDVDDHSEALILSGYEIYTPSPDTRNKLTELQLGWSPSQRAMINVYMQWNKFSEDQTNNDFRNQNYGLDCFFQLIPERLNLTMNYNLSRDSSRLGNDLFLEDDYRGDTANMQLTWKAMQARQLLPGVDFYLRGTYGKQDNRAYEDTNEIWSAHLGLEIQWAAGAQL